MTLAHPLLQQCIEFKENTINVLVVENAELFRNFAGELICQTEGDSGLFVLSENNKEIDFSKKAVVIENPLVLSVNNRRIQPKLNSMAEQTAYSNELLLHNAWEAVNALGNEIIAGLDFNTTFSEIETADVLVKLLNIRIDEDNLDFTEKIFEYMSLHRELLGIDLFIFVNLKSYLSSAELRMFYKEVVYSKYDILLFESSQKPWKIENERNYIIDESLCEIY